MEVVYRSNTTTFTGNIEINYWNGYRHNCSSHWTTCIRNKGHENTQDKISNRYTDIPVKNCMQFFFSPIHDICDESNSVLPNTYNALCTSFTDVVFLHFNVKYIPHFWLCKNSKKLGIHECNLPFICFPALKRTHVVISVSCGGWCGNPVGL